MLAHQVLDVERHLPTLLILRFGLESRHPALCDPIGHNPIDFAIGDPLHCFVGQIERLAAHKPVNSAMISVKIDSFILLIDIVYSSILTCAGQAYG